MTELQVAVILVAATWGSFGMTIRVFAAINQKRDLILRGRDKDTLYHMDHRVLMFYSDLIPMQAGISIFMGVFAYLLLSLPTLIDNSVESDKIELLSRIAALVPISGFLGYTFGGFKDIFNVGAVLSRRKSRLEQRTVSSILREHQRLITTEAKLLRQEREELREELREVLASRGNEPGHPDAQKGKNPDGKS